MWDAMRMTMTQIAGNCFPVQYIRSLNNVFLDGIIVKISLLLCVWTGACHEHQRIPGHSGEELSISEWVRVGTVEILTKCNPRTSNFNLSDTSTDIIKFVLLLEIIYFLKYFRECWLACTVWFINKIASVNNYVCQQSLQKNSYHARACVWMLLSALYHINLQLKASTLILMRQYYCLILGTTAGYGLFGNLTNNDYCQYIGVLCGHEKPYQYCFYRLCHVNRMTSQSLSTKMIHLCTYINNTTSSLHIYDRKMEICGVQQAMTRPRVLRWINA